MQQACEGPREGWRGRQRGEAREGDSEGGWAERAKRVSTDRWPGERAAASALCLATSQTLVRDARL